MKAVAMDRDYTFVVKRTVHVQYRNGVTYMRVPEIQARAIVAAKAGRIVEELPSIG